MKIEAAAEQFLRHLVLERGCSPLTAAAYQSDVRKLVEYLEQESTEADVGELTPIVLRHYVSFLAGEGYNPATIARRLYAVSSMFKYLINYGYADSNPCASVVVPKRHRRMPAVLNAEEARRVLEAAEGHTNPRMGFRNRAIVATLLFCGLRRAELVGLKVADVDLRSGWLKVRNGGLPP